MLPLQPLKDLMTATKRNPKASAPPVAIIMGSQSDWDTMRHAADTLDALSTHLGDTGPDAAKLVVWAHNSHLATRA